jgi:hypothetical protein
VDSVEYTVEELTAPDLFSKEDWEMLYAFAPDIDDSKDEEYRQNWRGYAEGHKQTAGQWRQYFEKVVWPQWREDPDEKHEMIKTRVERRLTEKEDGQKASRTEVTEPLPTQDEPGAGPSTPNARVPNTKRKRTDLDDNLFESYLTEHRKGEAPSAYVIFAREKKWDHWNQQLPGLDYGTCYYSNSFALVGD